MYEPDKSHARVDALIKQIGRPLDVGDIIRIKITKNETNAPIYFRVFTDSSSSHTVGYHDYNIGETVGTEYILQIVEEVNVASINSASALVAESYIKEVEITFEKQRTIPHVNYDIISQKNTPAISWVDDDFRDGYHQKVKEYCDSIDIKCDFALVPSTDGASSDYVNTYIEQIASAVGVDKDSLTDVQVDASGINIQNNDTYSFDNSVLQYVKQYEEEGYHFELHPVHKGWYMISSHTNYYLGKFWVLQSLMKTIRVFKENNIDYTGLIYAGKSGTYAGVLSVVPPNINYGVISSGSYNNMNEVSVYGLNRLFISLNNSHTKTYYKNYISEAVNKGALLIIGTHSWEWDWNDNTIDETTSSGGNLKEIISYANSLCNIQPLRLNIKNRKLMFMLQ